MSLQSALIGYLLPRVFATSVTAQENVVIQTTAVATGTMALAAGFVGIIPALSLLNVAQDGTPPIRLSWTAALAWSFAVAYYGFALLPRSYPCAPNYRFTARIILSPPIRKQVVRVPINPAFRMLIPNRLSKKSLPFPQGQPPLSLLPSSTNFHHQWSQQQVQRNILRSTPTRTTTQLPVNRLIVHLHTFPGAGDC